MPQICSHCRFWDRDGPGWKDGTGLSEGFQVCEAQESDGSASIVPYIEHRGREGAEGDTRGRGVLTAHDFGCILWEARDE